MAESLGLVDCLVGDRGPGLERVQNEPFGCRSQGGGATLAAGSPKADSGETGTAFDGIEFVGFLAMDRWTLRSPSREGQRTASRPAS